MWKIVILNNDISKNAFNNNVAMVEYKESFFRKIINKIKNTFA